MNRRTATLPDGVAELCLVRLGIQASRLSGVPYLWKVGRSLRRALREGSGRGEGLLHTELFVFGPRHLGLIQYWDGFDAMEAWARRTPHAEWWQLAVDRMRRRGDVGVYHETYLVGRDRVESIYLDCDPVGLLAFGGTGTPDGPLTNSRGRLGRRPPSDPGQ